MDASTDVWWWCRHTQRPRAHQTSLNSASVALFMKSFASFVFFVKRTWLGDHNHRVLWLVSSSSKRGRLRSAAWKLPKPSRTNLDASNVPLSGPYLTFREREVREPKRWRVSCSCCPDTAQSGLSWDWGGGSLQNPPVGRVACAGSPPQMKKQRGRPGRLSGMSEAQFDDEEEYPWSAGEKQETTEVEQKNTRESGFCRFVFLNPSLLSV